MGTEAGATRLKHSDRFSGFHTGDQTESFNPKEKPLGPLCPQGIRRSTRRCSHCPRCRLQLPPGSGHSPGSAAFQKLPVVPLRSNRRFHLDIQGVAFTGS